jgi:hypothetical protein
MLNTNITVTNIKTLSRQENNWLSDMCSDIHESHFSANTNIKHYACLVRHGRSKSSREKGGSR